MRKTMAGVVIAVVVGAGLASGCIAPSSTIASVRAKDYTGQVSNLFVVSQVGREGEISAVNFGKKLKETAAACGLRLGITHMSRLELDTSVHEQRLKQFAPQHILTLKQAGGVTGAVHWEYYDARLFDVEKPTTTVWRADVRLHRDGTLFGDPAEILAMDLLRKLRDDRFIAPCAQIVDPYDPFLGRQGTR